MKRFRDLLIDERTVVTAIVLNAIALTVLGFTDRSGSVAAAAFAVDYACVLFFLVEAALKISRSGWAGYWASGWNRFDFIVVTMSLPALAAPWIAADGVLALVVLRIGRLFRLFRLMRFIPDMDNLAAGIVRSLKASVGLFLALVLVNFILALGATLLFGESDPVGFGNPLRSVYSMFKVFTVEGWFEIADGVAAGAGTPPWGAFAKLYFVGCVLVGGILGLSLANAVFVDQMMMDNNNALERQVAELAAELRALREQLAGPTNASPEDASKEADPTGKGADP